MSTVDKAFADKVVAANGQLYPDDQLEPAITRIVKYTNAWGGEAFGIVFEGRDQDKYLRASEYVIDPSIYWERA